jgi:type IV pilus assembly protein PilP
MMTRRIIPLVLFTALAACSSRDADLDRFLEQTKQEPPGGIKPLPEVKPPDSFTYAAAGLRSPFAPGAAAGAGSSVRPNSSRNREHLESFPLDALKMAGTISVKGRTYGLVKTADNKVQQVLPGNYLGQNEGRITKIEPSKISITEIVQDGLGGYIERGTALELTE